MTALQAQLRLVRLRGPDERDEGLEVVLDREVLEVEVAVDLVVGVPVREKSLVLTGMWHRVRLVPSPRQLAQDLVALGGAERIWMVPRQLQVERRCTLAHELEHFDGARECCRWETSWRHVPTPVIEGPPRPEA